MRVFAFITQRAVIDRILDHVRRARESARGPPRALPMRPGTAAAPAGLTDPPFFIAAPDARSHTAPGTAVLHGRTLARPRMTARARAITYSILTSHQSCQRTAFCRRRPDQAAADGGTFLKIRQPTAAAIYTFACWAAPTAVPRPSGLPKESRWLRQRIGV